MILASCGYMLEDTIRELRSRGMTFHNPYRPTQGAWNPLRGAAKRVAAFCRPDIRVWGKAAHSHTWESLWPWLEVLDAKKAGLRRGAKKVAKERATDEDMASQQLTLSDWRDVLGMTQLPGRSDIDWLGPRVLKSKRPSFAYAFEVVRMRGAAELIRRPQIIVGTIHSVKGGQADEVYLYPDLSAAAMEQVDDDPGGEDAMIRLFYVGMTRARDRLVLVRAANESMAANIPL
jgi:superfamily I DNA/RNA helicase